jgi:hypothetical protein
VGADSRLSHYSPTSPARVDTGSVCKIFTCGRFNFATIGLNIEMAKNSALSQCKTFASFAELIKKYIDTFGTSLKA